MPPSLTIITRTYGARTAFLRSAAESVLAQTYPTIEWLIVEDGPSAAPDVVAALPVREGLTIRVLRNAKLGRSAAANRGLDAATGAYLMFFDDDDELFPEHAATLVALLEDAPLATAAYAAAYEAERQEERPGAPITAQRVHFLPVAGSGTLLRTNPFPIQAVVVRRGCIFHQRFDTRLDALEDWLFWTEILLERELIWTPRITSRFYVPASVAARQSRLDSHRIAEPEYAIQAQAFFAERGMYRYGDIVADADNRLQRLAVRARQTMTIE